MKNVIELLDRHYQSFTNQQRDWDFFLGLAYYVRCVVETPELDNILKYITRAQNNDQRRLAKYEQAVIKETRQAKKTLFKIIKENKISNEALNRTIEEYEDYENRKIYSSQSTGETLSDNLIEIIDILFKEGYKKLLKDFVIVHKTIPGRIDKYIFSKTLDSYYKEKEIYEEKLKTELWASWNNLILAYLAVFKAREAFEKTRRFKKEDYIGYATIIHNYLIQELKKQNGEASKTEKINWFNHKNNVINFYGETYKPRSEPQAKFIKELTRKHQRQTNTGTILSPGERILETVLANQINVPIKQIKGIKKQLKRNFKSKSFPLKIDSNAEGILLIYTI